MKGGTAENMNVTDVKNFVKLPETEVNNIWFYGTTSMLGDHRENTVELINLNVLKGVHTVCSRL